MNEPGINPQTLRIKLDDSWYGGNQKDPVQAFVQEKLNELKSEGQRYQDEQEKEILYGSKTDYSTITKEQITSILKDVTYPSLKSLEELQKEVTKAFAHIKELPKGFNLDNHIKDDYMYEIRGAGVLATGAGGIRMFIEAARKQGMPDVFIAQDIYVFDYTTGRGGWIGDVKWTPKEKE